MLATLDFIRERYGSVEQYVLEQCRLDAATVAAIRRNLIVDAVDPIDWEAHARVMSPN